MKATRLHIPCDVGRFRMPSPASTLRRAPSYGAVVASWTGRLVLACSGGIDSTGLLVLAAHARDNGRITPFVCIHVDHQARPESGAEAETVASTCRLLKVPFVRLSIDGGDAHGAGSPEDILREARYRSLAQAVDALGLDGVATAHTNDDQIETVLMRLLSGAGPSSMTGMRLRQQLSFAETSVRVVRPLLAVRRAALVAIVERAGLDVVDDPSNADVSLPRNRLRSRVIPELERSFPGFQTALARSVSLVAEDAGYLDALAAAVAPSVVAYTSTGVHIKRDWLRREHPAVSRRVLRTAILTLLATETSDRRRELTFERLEAVRVAATRRTGACIELPGGYVATIGRESVEVVHGGATGSDDTY